MKAKEDTKEDTLATNIFLKTNVFWTKRRSFFQYEIKWMKTSVD